MLRLVVVLLIPLWVAPAQADWFHKLVGYQCDQDSGQVVVRYVGAYNEAGEDMINRKGQQEWDPWSLITMKDDDHIGDLKTVEGTCQLQDGLYRITIGPEPGNFNIQGRCGAHISAWVEIQRGAEVVLPRYIFEGDCHDMDSPITTEIIVKVRSERPLITEVPWDDFYQ